MSVREFLVDILSDPRGGFSHTKLWSNIGAAVFTVIVVAREAGGALSEDLLIWYAGLLIANVALSKGMSLTAIVAERR
jgi:hypothetical protein